jgi:protein-S-isoprenylcysteine O-methyltransferase Ste14
MGFLATLLALSILTSAVALLHVRREYRGRGRLSMIGVSLLCLMFFMPNLLLEYATNYRWPDTALAYAGWTLCATGLVICAYAVVSFNSLAKVFCTDPGELTLGGLYRWSRNPQYAGWLLFIFGFSLTDWNAWCLAAMLVLAVCIHLLVLIEEEHLLRVFGEPYEVFRQRVPRYFSVFS